MMSGNVNILILACLFSILTALIIRDDSNRSDESISNDLYHITPLKVSSGVYYEHVEEMRRSVSNCRIAIFLDIGQHRRYYDDLISRMKKLRGQCKSGENWCSQSTEHYYWDNRWEMVAELQKQFQTQFEELEMTRLNLPKKLGTQLRL